MSMPEYAVLFLAISGGFLFIALGIFLLKNIKPR